MRRGIATGWQLLSFSLAAGLFFFFVLPRWPELDGHLSHTAGTVLRIVTGLLLALTALPVLMTLRRTRRPEFGTPQLALNLRTFSIVGHLLAGLLIVGTAVAEIWVSLDQAGPWLFGIYGAAAAIAVLAAVPKRVTPAAAPVATEADDVEPRGLRNKRPSEKDRRGGVALSD